MKIFISHSSADKERYCNTVVNKLIERLGSDPVVYDFWNHYILKV